VEGSFQVARNLAKQMAMPMPAVDLTKIDKSPLASLHFAKALSHYYAGNLDPALMQFMRAVDLDPDYTEAHYWSGLCYSKQGEHADAVIEWEQFLKDQPNSKYAPQVKKLLAEAKALEKVSAAPRLAPASAPATQPATDGAKG
jgi:tetratricopeptide (TPR) repeat protein